MAYSLSQTNQPLTYDFVFVILVYRNTGDLVDFFHSFNIPSSRIIIINSFYDDSSEHEFKKISQIHNADFISVPNKGYGAGNNAGIVSALKKYYFKYLIISNADIEIKKLNIENLSLNCITAPKIIARSGKYQNPHTPFYSKNIERLKYKYFLKRSYKKIRMISAINKICRYIFFILYKLKIQNCIYAAHGAFLIIPYKILTQLHPLFNEKMFLYAEEDHLANLALRHKIPICYNPKIVIYHKEDGSTGIEHINTMEHTRNSYITYYLDMIKRKNP